DRAEACCGSQCLAILLTQHPAIRLSGPGIQLFRLGIFAGMVIDPAQVDHDGQGRGVLRTQRSATERQSLLELLLRLSVKAHLRIGIADSVANRSLNFRLAVEFAPDV